MSIIFNIEDKVVYPTPEILMVEPYKKIWNRDKTKNKDKALLEFAYVEFMTSMKMSNPFRDYEEDIKESKILLGIGMKKTWKPDALIKEAIEKSNEFQKEASLSYRFFISAKTGMRKLQDFFDTVNLKERNPKSQNVIYKPRDITVALQDTEKLLINFKNLEKRVEQDLYETTKTRNNKRISIFADPNSFR